MTDREHEIMRDELADREDAEIDAAEERADVMRDEAAAEAEEEEPTDEDLRDAAMHRGEHDPDSPFFRKPWSWQ